MHIKVILLLSLLALLSLTGKHVSRKMKLPKINAHNKTSLCDRSDNEVSDPNSDSDPIVTTISYDDLKKIFIDRVNQYYEEGEKFNKTEDSGEIEIVLLITEKDVPSSLAEGQDEKNKTKFGELDEDIEVEIEKEDPKESNKSKEAPKVHKTVNIDEYYDDGDAEFGLQEDWDGDRGCQPVRHCRWIEDPKLGKIMNCKHELVCI